MAKQILWTEAIRARVETGRPQFLVRACAKALCAGKPSVLLDVAASDRPDLIILAHDDPEMPARDLCRWIRADDRTRAIPILALAGGDDEARRLKEAGCTEVLPATVSAESLQEKIASLIGMRLRKYPRYPVVLPVARGRFIREFLGYSNAVSEGGMGFDTLTRIKGGASLPLLIYRNTEERPIAVTGRVASVRANIDTGIGYAVGVEFREMAATDRGRLLELFPGDPTVTWGPDPPDDRRPGGPTRPGP